MSKTEQLQIRVSREEKAALRRRAREAGLDLSAFVLARALPPQAVRFETIIAALATADDHRYVLAELNDLLTGLNTRALSAAVESVPVAFDSLDPFPCNYVAAMVEQACARAGVAPPSWAARVPPLADPYFATPLRSLRLHLLAASPVAFRRRNIFIDTGVGGRV
jgi:uncharacterized protein (DUF1778 family)